MPPNVDTKSTGKPQQRGKRNWRVIIGTAAVLVVVFGAVFASYLWPSDEPVKPPAKNAQEQLVAMLRSNGWDDTHYLDSDPKSPDGAVSDVYATATVDTGTDRCQLVFSATTKDGPLTYKPLKVKVNGDDSSIIASIPAASLPAGFPPGNVTFKQVYDYFTAHADDLPC